MYGVFILVVGAVHAGLSISFSIQRWNELTRSGRPAPDSILREQIGDSLLGGLVMLAVVLVEPVRYHLAAGIGLGLVMGVLVFRLVRRTHRGASLRQ